MSASPTLFEWAGGMPALEKLTEVFDEHVHADPVLALVFAHVGSEHAQHVAQWLAEEQRRRWAQLISEAADEAGLPDDPEFRSAFVAYVEWGSRIGRANSAPGASPPAQAPVPRWGWGEAPPYIPPDDTR